MDLALSPQQFEAVSSAKHVPDTLRRVLDAARPGANGGRVLALTYEEATALQELCAWNVHTDGSGAVTPDSKIFDDIVNTILTHPDY